MFAIFALVAAPVFTLWVVQLSTTIAGGRVRLGHQVRILLYGYSLVLVAVTAAFARTLFGAM